MADIDSAEMCAAVDTAIDRRDPSIVATATQARDNTSTDISRFRQQLFSKIEAQSREIRDDLAHVPDNIQTSSRFQIQEKLASGGLGEVYKAYDNRLRRVVALKISKRRSSPRSRGRDEFLREYRVTAKLQHPGVPAVYSVGRLKNGRRFYAMRLVSGQTLSEIAVKHGLPDLRRPGAEFDAGLRSLLQHFHAVCDTVDAAHDAGFVHLDLKPDNIVVEPHGATFVVDWGLARRFVRVRAAADAETHQVNHGAGNKFREPAVIAGTLEFMAPEQLAGDRALFGPSTDVFALGGILHLILTGQPPRLRPQNVSGTRFFSFVRAARISTAITPALTSPILDTAPELASICNKALAPAVADRYQSAQELREDLERWERREYVSAHRGKYRWTEVAARFAARHARVMMVSVSILVVLSAALGLAGWQQARAARYEVAAEKAALDRRIASQVALTALEQQVAGVQRQQILRRPELLPLRLEMLQAAWNQYEQWAVGSIDDPELKFRLVKQLHEMVATIEETVSELALLDHRVNSSLGSIIASRSLDLSRELIAVSPAEPEATRLLATSLRLCARHPANSGDASAAEAMIQEAARCLSTLLASHTEDRSTARDLMRSERMLASLRFQAAMAAQSVEERRRLLQEAADFTTATERLTPSLDLADASHVIELASLENQAGIVIHKLSHVETAGGHYERALTLLETIPAAEPAEDVVDDRWIERQRLQARILNNYGMTLRGLGRSADAMDAHRQARQIRAAILQQYPWMLSARSELAQSLGNIADTTVDFADPTAEIQARRDAVELLRQTFEDYPSMAGVKEFWGLHRVRIVAALHRQGNDTEAAQEFQEIIEVCPQPELAEPTNSGHLLDVALGHCLVALNGNAGDAAIQAAVRLVQKCYDLNQIREPANRERLLSDPAFSVLQQVPALEVVFATVSQR